MALTPQRRAILQREAMDITSQLLRMGKGHGADKCYADTYNKSLGDIKEEISRHSMIAALGIIKTILARDEQTPARRRLPAPMLQQLHQLKLTVEAAAAPFGNLQ